MDEVLAGQRASRFCDLTPSGQCGRMLAQTGKGKGMTKQAYDENGYEIETETKDQQPQPTIERLNYSSAGAVRKYPKGHRKYQGE